MRKHLPSHSQPVIVGIDPGNHKCGIAVVDRAGTRIYSEVCPRRLLQNRLSPIFARYTVSYIAVGSRTGSEGVLREIESMGCGYSTVTVEEAKSTREGMSLYASSAPAGLSWLYWLMLILGIAKADGWAALVIARRSLQYGAEIADAPANI
ncbi:MAG: hypothetical protein HRF49_02950 [bacterium]